MPKVRESVVRPYWASPDGRCVIYHGDSLDLLPKLVRGEASLICTDPPYFGVKDNDWDNQWGTDDEFMEWVSEVLGLFGAALSQNGSLYWFSSPRLAARIELEIAKSFNVLNSLVWFKGNAAGGGLKSVEALRSFWPATERIVFAERYYLDTATSGTANYTQACDELRGEMFDPIREYLDRERELAGVSVRQIAEAFQKKSGSRTVTGMSGHWFGSVQWALPTAENYEWLRGLFGKGRLARSHNDLKSEYISIQKSYDVARLQLDGLRRPFSLTKEMAWGDVWQFPSPREQVHPTQKPVPLMSHIVRVSSREGDLVVDPFMGSGTTGVSCAHLGRRFIGIEQSEKYCELAETRIKVAYQQAASKSRKS